jgi:hypothetical protein
MKTESNINCGCGLVVLIFNLIVGTIATNFLISVFFGTVIPTFWAMVIGLIAGEVVVPLALVVWILKSLGVIG